MTADLRIGAAVGPYHIVSVAGSGGMGVVYRAEQSNLSRTVALKVIRSEVADSRDYRARFLREARLAAAVNHPNVVSVFDVGEEGGDLYIAMQWIDGVTLRKLINDHGALHAGRTVRIGVQTAHALGAVHDAGLIHRDVKPTNVLIRNIGGEDHAYLLDFGVAKPPEAFDDLTATGWIVGTSGYLAPEQIMGKEPDSRSDLYALGCVVFEALTGARPFTAENDMATRWAHANAPRPLVSSVRPELGNRYDTFIAKALSIEPDARYSSGLAFAQALETAHGERPLHTSAPLSGPDDATEIRAGTSPSEPSVLEPTDAPKLERTTTRRHNPTPTSVPDPAAARTVDRTAAGATEPTAASSGTRAGARHPPAGRSSRSAAIGAAMVVAGGIVFLIAVWLLGDYINDGTGLKSLRFATNGDPNSPLYPHDFWTVVVLVACAVLLAVISLRRYRRILSVGAIAASLGLIGYTIYIPTKGRFPGLSHYGSSYWLSLAAAVVVLIGASVSAISGGGRPDADAYGQDQR